MRPRESAGRRTALLFVLVALTGCGRGEAPRGQASPESRALVSEAAARMDEGRVDLALGALDRARELSPRDAEVRVARAAALEAAARYREARDEALEAHRLAPGDDQIALTALRLDSDFIRPRETEALARRVVARLPNDPNAHLWLGIAIAGADDPRRFPEALEHLREANRLSPRSADPLIRMGKLHERMGDLDRAEGMHLAARRALEAAPPPPGAHVDALARWVERRRTVAFCLAGIHQRRGRVAESRREAAEAARWSARASELRRIRNRAFALPPDPAAQARLQQAARLGLEFWRD